MYEYYHVIWLGWIGCACEVTSASCIGVTRDHSRL